MNSNRYLRRSDTLWRLRSTTLTLGSRTLVMGIVNLTEDSFSDGGRYLDPDLAVAHALGMLDEGADLLDLGAESTRPGAAAGNPHTAAVTAQEEQNRLLPVIAGILKERPGTILSVDTYKAATARAAIAAGAEIVNDVSGFTWDEGMAQSCAELGCGVIAMHTRGRPQAWSRQPRLAADEVLAVVQAGLAQRLRLAEEHCIRPEAIVFDPGYGFGKRGEENYGLLAHQAELLCLGRPLLAGLSRKSFLGRTVESRTSESRMGSPAASAAVPAESVETASTAALVIAILHGASIVRVHAVRPAVEAAAIADAVLAGL